MSLREVVSWHRPLMLVGLVCAALIPLGVLGTVLDPREVLGAPVWLKPTKFVVSVTIFAISWAWLFAQVRERHGRVRGAHLAGTTAAVTLAIEIVVIVVQSARGTTSHFNVTTGLDGGLWAVMAVSIVTAWLGTLWLTGALFTVRGLDPARALAIRAGALIALAGMALGFLMTRPNAAQLADFQGIIGAHTVGLPDGGPGLPVVGWSTLGGDLRVPHFVGMHALQILPLVLVALEAAASRSAVLADPRVRRDLVATAAAGYVALLAVLTWQALRGQALLAPDAWTTTALATTALLVGVGAIVALRRRAPATA